jgi:hypothetical protein
MVMDSGEVVALVANYAFLLRLSFAGLAWRLWVNGSPVRLEAN